METCFLEPYQSPSFFNKLPFSPLPHSSSIFQPLPWSPFPQWLAEVYRSQGLLVQGVMAYRQSLHLASQLGVHNSQVASLLRLALLALVPCMVSSWIAMGDEKKLRIFKSVAFPCPHSVRRALSGTCPWKWVDRLASRSHHWGPEAGFFACCPPFPGPSPICNKDGRKVSVWFLWFLLQHRIYIYFQHVADVKLLLSD